MDNIRNSQTVQNLANGPVAEKARNEADATKNEFGNLAASRQTPQTQTATGQDLTHYHSFFYNLLSWENPRATAISYAMIVAFVFTTRYVPVTRYALRVLYITLGVTAALEIAGKVILGEGLASKLRPRKYYTIPHENLESVLSDVEELTNFFVIEFQRIVFAENVYATVAAFVTAFLGYYLVKIMPAWGLVLLSTTVIYFAPLVYISNKELIDYHINNASNIVAEQTSQLREVAAQQTNNAVSSTSSLLKDYTGKAQEAIGQTKQAAVEKNIISPETAEKITPEKSVHDAEFPSAPKEEPSGPELTQAEEKTAEPIVA
ncbi:Reticulon-like protein 1 [Fulvia fulva]|uniref:Reticulon-like protein n=1 Tax=Passalora fulva TaxID=5499 RepID=A0A9Q8PHS6_PASFU|nr:Reticulon-like protein 1 [Fulvia fulva]KAK4626869.1 Reticulon-like protein 1 [Fulvia fulva]KAK4627728.1 Reticulon-like protein 1 [Fulvia fulva]UJO22657.1 Reticulon-like protein 1 [Fulvia fulva]WPV13443.1 Reticulon-like protein 1 [Fulvia fulva]WPV28251.1 Reticulon-like protein 1 [Fulvia fulva]